MNQDLIQEIEKWTKKIEDVVDSIEVNGDKGEEMLRNMKAYISDSRYFRDEGDLVRSFEAIVYAYGILETCIKLGVFNVNR